MSSAPDFWLVECDTFWHELGVRSVACFILDGPRRMLTDYEVEQWLVRVDPPVTDNGVTTDRVLVDRHEPVWREGDDWAIFCTGVYSLDPADHTHQVGGHKMTATTLPDVYERMGR
jgi:hypothetical protein